jgi:hypothetical protein
MTVELKAGEWHALTKGERIALCRRLAEEAQKDHSAGSELAPSWADLASQWRMLAAEIERSH